MENAKSFFDGAFELLKYGPIGLAALLLILAAITLLGSLDEMRERLLKQFLYVGAFCFVVSSLTSYFVNTIKDEHMLHLSVYPNDLGAKRTLPAPVIKVNGAQLNDPFQYPVRSEITAIIDVSDAINFVQAFRAQTQQQAHAISNFAAVSDTALSKLQEATRIALSSGCPGGSSGRPFPSGGTIAALNSEVSGSLSNAKATVQDMLKWTPPAP